MAIVGRDDERAAVDALLSARSGGLLLAGEPGIGKTVLWERGLAAARDTGWTVLEHRSASSEAAYAFSGLTDLLEGMLDDVVDELAPPRRRALEVALLLAEAREGEVPDARAIGLALLDVLRALAERGPVLLALDDVQWLDASSAAVVSVALRRLRAGPVAVLATMRTSAGAGDALAGVPLERLSLAPLDLASVHRMLRDRLGLELPRPTLARIHRAAAGNPYFALELARDGAEEVPDSLRELLGSRLDRLPPDVLAVLLDAAALAQPTVALVSDGSDERLGALATAAHEGIVRIADERITFVHPLLASISYDRAMPWERQAAHRRLAERVPDPEERARHLALAAGDATDAALADELDAAARRAAARGATAAAAELLDLAVRHTPADAGERVRRRLQAAQLHRLAGDLEHARRRYGEVLEDVPSGPDRAEVLLAMALTLHDGVRERAVLCERALEHVGEDDALSARVLGCLALHRWTAGRSREALRDARAGLQQAERVGDGALIATAIAAVSAIETWMLEVTPGLLEHGVELEHQLGDAFAVQFSILPSYWHVVRLILTDSGNEARILLGRLDAAAEAHGDEHAHAQLQLLRINLERFAGRPKLALPHVETVRELAAQVADAELRTNTASFSAGAFAETGRLDEAEALGRHGLALAQELGNEVQEVMVLGVLGRLALLRGDGKHAHELLDPLPDRLHDMGHLHPAGMPWADAIEAAIATGRLDRAAEVLAAYASIAARASRWAQASATRCAGVLALARGDDARALAAFERALVEEGGTHPLERGRILLGLGMTHRHARRGREARSTLEQAIVVLDEAGGRPWRDQAAMELGRISGRRGHGDELTPAEQRVAELAAEGRQNKEIAAELFLTVATVEAHLSRVYRKLGLRSRTELAKAMANV